MVPQPEALIKRMMEVESENSVMGDMATREKIASLPPEIHDPDLFTKIKGEPTITLYYAITLYDLCDRALKTTLHTVNDKKLFFFSIII